MHNDKSRILLLIDCRNVGGIETHVANLASALRRRNKHVEILLLNDYGDTPAVDLFRRACVPFKTINSLPRLFRVLREARPCLLHTHGYKAGIIGRIVAAFAATPCISTFHAGERGRFPVNIYQWIDEKLAFLATPLAVSTPIARRLRQAILSPAFVPTPSHIPAVTSNCIAFVGRLSHEKGPDIFCQIATRLRDQFSFRAYGDGPLSAQLRASAAGSVDFKGHVSDMSTEWASIGLLVMTSRAEGLPLVCLEALSHGVPVLAARVGGLPEIIEQNVNGWLFEPNDIDNACDKIKDWSRLPLSRKITISDSCREGIQARFDEADAVDSLLKIYSAAAPFGSRMTIVQSSTG